MFYDFGTREGREDQYSDEGRVTSLRDMVLGLIVGVVLTWLYQVVKREDERAETWRRTVERDSRAMGNRR
jgi:hypothetical protein